LLAATGIGLDPLSATALRTYIVAQILRLSATNAALLATMRPNTGRAVFASGTTGATLFGGLALRTVTKAMEMVSGSRSEFRTVCCQLQQEVKLHEDTSKCFTPREACSSQLALHGVSPIFFQAMGDVRSTLSARRRPNAEIDAYADVGMILVQLVQNLGKEVAAVHPDKQDSQNWCRSIDLAPLGQLVIDVTAPLFDATTPCTTLTLPIPAETCPNEILEVIARLSDEDRTGLGLAGVGIFADIEVRKLKSGLLNGGWKDRRLSATTSVLSWTEDSARWETFHSFAIPTVDLPKTAVVGFTHCLAINDWFLCFASKAVADKCRCAMNYQIAKANAQ
jgi:hypothetical protein